MHLDGPDVSVGGRVHMCLRRIPILMIVTGAAMAAIFGVLGS